jgi:uncharacterized protein involved in exopolysaccharide biosynthesis
MERQHMSKNRERRGKDFVAAIFRRRRLASISFIVIFTLAAGALLMQPNTYQSEMKILVSRGRVDPMVTTDSTAVARATEIVSDQDLSSEIELLRSRDLLEQAVLDCRLDVPKKGPLQFVFGSMKLNASAASSNKPDPKAWQTAVRRLDEDLKILPLRGSHLIAATYDSSNPQQAACVLNALGKRYVDKYLSVHRPTGTYEFFKAEADRQRSELERIQAEMINLQGPAGPATDLQQEIAVRHMGDVSASLDQKKAAISELEARIKTLEQHTTQLKPRNTTEIRTLPNPQVAELQSTLTTLKMKRADMAEKYTPTYRTVLELDRQIRDVEEAIAFARRNPITEEATNSDPEFEWSRLELAKAKSDLAALRAAVPTAASTVRQYQARTAQLEKDNIRRRDLERMAKVAEENYLVNLRKQEQARISDALDRQRILNVAIAEEATVPLVPVESRAPLRFGFAAVLSGLMSLGLAFGTDHFKRTFHTPNDVTAIIGVPVLAAYPKFENSTANSQQGVSRS